MSCGVALLTTSVLVFRAVAWRGLRGRLVSKYCIVDRFLEIGDFLASRRMLRVLLGSAGLLFVAEK